MRERQGANSRKVLDEKKTLVQDGSLQLRKSFIDRDGERQRAREVEKRRKKSEEGVQQQPPEGGKGPRPPYALTELVDGLLHPEDLHDVKTKKKKRRRPLGPLCPLVRRACVHLG